MHIAADMGNAATASVLIEKGAADVEAHDAEGNTPLHLALEMGHAEVASLLLAKGAQRASKNHRGQSAESMVEKIKWHTDRYQAVSRILRTELRRRAWF